MDSTPTPTIPASPVNQDAESAHQPQTALLVSLYPLPTETAHALAPARLTSQSPMELVTALPAVLSARPALMPLPALPVCPPTPRLLTTNASAGPGPSSTPTTTVFLAPTDAKTVLQLQSATAVSVLSSSRDPPAKSLATTDSLSLELLASAAPLDVSNALKTCSVTTVLTDTTCTTEDATLSALLEQSATRQVETGTVYPVTLPARPASTTPPTAPVVSMEWDTSRPQPSNNLAFSTVSMEPMSATESAKSATSDAPPVLAQPPTVSHVPLVKYSITEDAGPLVPQSVSPKTESTPPVLKTVLLATTKSQ